LVSAASESKSIDADVHPAASLADAKNNILTVIAILILGWLENKRREDNSAKVGYKLLVGNRLMFSGDIPVIWQGQGGIISQFARGTH